MAKAIVDQKKCIGCGACTSICPGAFELDSNGKSIFKHSDCKGCDCESAVEVCPVGAITLK